MAGLAALGPTYSDLWLNAVFRGSVGTPPTTIYLGVGSDGSTLIPVEVSTTRTPVILDRGFVNGTDSPVYKYPSSGTVANPSPLVVQGDGHFLFCTGMSTNEYLAPAVLAYDASSGGNLLFVAEPSANGLVLRVIDGDVLLLGTRLYTVTSSPYAVVAKTDTSLPPFLQRDETNYVYLGTYPYSMLVDWLLRGEDAVNERFPVGTYPYVYAYFTTSGDTEITAIPRLAIPRNTSVWGAPAAVSPGVNLERKITNSVDFTFGAATAGGSYSSPRFKIAMSNVAQAFDDTLHVVILPSLAFSAGDTVRFLAGSLDVVIN